MREWMNLGCEHGIRSPRNRGNEPSDERACMIDGQDLNWCRERCEVRKRTGAKILEGVGNRGDPVVLVSVSDRRSTRRDLRLTGVAGSLQFAVTFPKWRIEKQ